jgi:hypothetical protein
MNVDSYVNMNMYTHTHRSSMKLLFNDRKKPVDCEINEIEAIATRTTGPRNSFYLQEKEKKKKHTSSLPEIVLVERQRVTREMVYVQARAREEDEEFC